MNFHSKDKEPEHEKNMNVESQSLEIYSTGLIQLE